MLQVIFAGLWLKTITAPTPMGPVHESSPRNTLGCTEPRRLYVN